MWKGEVVAIFVGPTKGDPMSQVPEARGVQGQGIEGDRFYGKSLPGDRDKTRQVTLIEEEALEAAKRDHGVTIEAVETRRNLVTRGVPLNHLIGVTFRAGGLLLRGRNLCEPCDHLEGMTRPGVKKALVHRGGLRCDVLEGGTVRSGDAIEPAR